MELGKLYLITVGFVAIAGLLAVVGYIYSEAISLKTSIKIEPEIVSSIPQYSDVGDFNDFAQFIVIFGLYKDGIPTRISCIGAHIGNSSIISTDSCLESYRRNNLLAIMGFANNLETIKIASHKRHYDYVNLNNSEADIIFLKLNKNVTSHNQIIQLENNVDRNLRFYTVAPYHLYRISVDKNFTLNKELVTAKNIKDCDQNLYCLESKDSEFIVGSYLIARNPNDQYLLLGLQQNRIIQNNSVPFTKLPLYVSWINSQSR